ncbi:hypothetical protein FXO37_31323 [Capsicum annuum]|nr:hypothetical protein FXO37_31323 [Capsicum annuum]
MTNKLKRVNEEISMTFIEVGKREEKVRPCDQEATGLNRGNGLLQNKNVCNRFFKEENVRLCDQEATGKNLESSSSNAADKKIVELPHSFNYGSIGKLNSIRVDGESLCTHCDICEDVFPPNMLIQGNSCQNLYCKECIQKYIAKKINYDIHEVKCPIVNCKGTVGLELLLPYDVLDRVENANREAKVLASPYIMDCPYEDCTGKLVDHQKCASKIEVDPSDTQFFNRNEETNSLLSFDINKNEDDIMDDNDDMQLQQISLYSAQFHSCKNLESSSSSVVGKKIVELPYSFFVWID